MEIHDQRIQDILKTAEVAGNLPSPRGVALEVLRIVAADDTCVADLARVIENDPAISARILKAVNSPLAGVILGVASVHQAVGLLGFQNIKAITIALSLLSEKRAGPCKEFDYQKFWSESLARGVAMRHLAGHIKTMPADEAFTYGLLSLIGRLALVSMFPNGYERVLLAIGTKDRAELAEAEAAVFQIDSDELSALMMREWGMPHAYTAVQCEDQMADQSSKAQAMGSMMQLSATIAEILVEPNTFRDQLALLSRYARCLGINPDGLRGLFDHIALEWQIAGNDMAVETRSVLPLPDLYAGAADRSERSGPPTAPVTPAA